MRRMLIGPAAIAILASASAPALAQEAPAELISAYEQYAAARLSLGQAEAEDVSAEMGTAVSAQQALLGICSELGASSLDACLDQYVPPEMRIPGDLDPIEALLPAAEPAPELVEEPVQEVVEEPAPEAVEEPEPEVVEEPLPEPKPEPEIVEEAQPEPVAEEPAPQPEMVEEQEEQEPVVAVEEPEPEPEVSEELAVEEPTPAEEAEAETVVLEPVEPVDPVAEQEFAPETVAPLLDSAKDVISVEESAETPSAEPEQAPVVAEEPAAPPPQSDAEAQAQAAPVEIQSVTAEQGEPIAAETEARAATRLTAPAEAKVVQKDESGFRIVLQFNNQLIVQNQDRPRLREEATDHYVERLHDGRIRETIERADGTRIVTIYNRNGDILRRSRFTSDGEEWVLVYVDEDREEDLLEWRDPGLDLPPLRLTIPARDYILDAEDADERELVEFLDQPPVERVQRLYSIDEVKRSARIRDMVRRLEIGGLTFDTGKATIAPSQVGALTKVANAMLDLLEDNPAETFLIEGHTDAVGSDISNLELSDRRAETVAVILTRVFGIPPENLATQGYGERYLKIRTQEAERLNRRVTIKRITPLIAPIARR